MACFVALLFLIMKFFEMRLIQKEDVPLKLLVKDTILVFCSVIGGDYLIQQMHSVNHLEQTQVFTDTPMF